MGLPLGYWLCFAGGWGVQGLWIGLSTGLIIVGGVLLIVWARHSRTIASQFASAPVGREAWEARHEA